MYKISGTRKNKKIILDSNEVEEFGINDYLQNQEKVDGYVDIKDLLYEFFFFENFDEGLPESYDYEFVMDENEPNKVKELIIKNIKWEEV
jgi:hypothetical protein